MYFMKPRDLEGERFGIVFENQTESHLLSDVIDAYSPLVREEANFYPTPFMEGRCSDEDLALARQLATEWEGPAHNLLWRGEYPSSVTNARGYRLPGTIDKHPGLTVSTKQLSELMALPLLVAIQTPFNQEEIDAEPKLDYLERRTVRVNNMIHDGGLAVELVLGQLTEDGLTHMRQMQSDPQRHYYVPFGQLLDRYLAKREGIIAEASEAKNKFLRGINEEYTEADYGSSHLNSNERFGLSRSLGHGAVKQAIDEYINRQPFFAPLEK
jgi:hypothetical protein